MSTNNVENTKERSKMEFVHSLQLLKKPGEYITLSLGHLLC
jgi:hypothetical protein